MSDFSGSINWWLRNSQLQNVSKPQASTKLRFSNSKVYLGLILSLLVGVIFAEIWSKFSAPRAICCSPQTDSSWLWGCFQRSDASHGKDYGLFAHWQSSGLKKSNIVNSDGFDLMSISNQGMTMFTDSCYSCPQAPTSGTWTRKCLDL